MQSPTEPERAAEARLCERSSDEYILNKRPWTASPALINVEGTGQNQFNMLKLFKTLTIFFQTSQTVIQSVCKKLLKQPTKKCLFFCPTTATSGHG